MLHRVDGRVKWFDKKKGIGFVERDGHRDALLHINVIRPHGREFLLPGTPIKCEGVLTDKGIRITQIDWIGEPPAKRWVTCKWKWFHQTTGYGFAVTPDGEDVYIHRKTLKRAGMQIPIETNIEGLLVDVIFHKGGLGCHALETRWTLA